MCTIMYCRHCDCIVTSLPIIATNALWSVMTCTSCAKENWWNFSNPSRIPSASFSILCLYCWQRWWARALSCLVLYCIQNLGYPLPASSVAVVLCIAGIVIALSHLYPLLLPMLCGLWWHVLHVQRRTGGTSQTQAEFLVPPFLYCVYIADKGDGPEHCTVWYFIVYKI